MQILWKSDTNNRTARQGLQAGKISVCGLTISTFEPLLLYAIFYGKSVQQEKLQVLVYQQL